MTHVPDDTPYAYMCDAPIKNILLLTNVTRNICVSFIIHSILRLHRIKIFNKLAAKLDMPYTLFSNTAPHMNLIRLRHRSCLFPRTVTQYNENMSGDSHIIQLLCRWHASFRSLWAAVIRCAHKRIVNTIKVYIERNNMQVELIKFRKKDRLHSRLLLRSEEFSDRRNVYAARSMDLCDRQITMHDWWICVIDYRTIYRDVWIAAIAWSRTSPATLETCLPWK